MPEKFSSNENEGGDFLKEKYPDLVKSPEVESAARRQEIREDEKMPNDPKVKIGAYLSRLNEIFNPEEKDKDKKEFRIEFLKEKLHDKFVIKEIPESYFKQQQKIAREQGHGDIEITDQLKEETLKTITADQKQSLDNWIDYLGSTDATYPDWLKYWAFRSITGLSQYDKEAHEFKKRSKTTTAPFPDINREALAYVLDEAEKQQKEKKRKNKTETPQTDEQWAKLLETKNFGKLYAHAIEKITPASEEEKENIQGEWVKYDQGSDAKPLYESLQGHGTGWCTAGESTAEAQLKMGDFYVFYSKDQQGSPKIPRIAIRMQEGEIAEVRGIESNQNLEGVMADVTKEKMQTLPGGEKYEKKASDMKRLTEIEKKFTDTTGLKTFLKRINEDYTVDPKDVEETKEELNEIYLENKKVELTKDELKFLYEIDGKIEGFGYQDDPRIDELKERRYKEEDLAKIFDCKVEEVSEMKMMSDFGAEFIKIDRKNRDDFFKNNPDANDRDYSDTPAINETKKLIDAENDKIVVLLGDLNPYGYILKKVPKNLKYVLGGAVFTETESLGVLEGIGGDANFVHSELKDLGQLKTIGGNATISKDSKLDFSKIKIGGELFKNT